MIEVNNVVDLNFLPGDILVTPIHEKEMDVLRFKYKDCVATVGWGDVTVQGKKKKWATVYKIESKDSPRENITFLLRTLKKMYEKQRYDFGYSFADTSVIKSILYKLGIKVREKGTGEIVK